MYNLRNDQDSRPEKRRYPPTDQLRLFFNSSLDLICSINQEMEFVHVNDASFSILGYYPEELTGRVFMDFVAAEDRERTMAAASSIMVGEDLIQFENCYSRKDGRVVTLSWSCRWDAKERVMVCIARDITERKAKEALQAQYEQKVKKQHREMTEILERITDGFFSMDEKWRITYINPQVEKMLDIRREDYLTRDYWECFPEMVGSVYYEQYHKAMNTGMAVHFVEYFPPFSCWFAVDAYPSETGLSVFFRDVSEQKKMK